MSEEEPKKRSSSEPLYVGDVGAAAWITAFVGCVLALALASGVFALISYGIYRLF